jgi:hypothetical protein
MTYSDFFFLGSVFLQKLAVFRDFSAKIQQRNSPFSAGISEGPTAQYLQLVF